MEYKEKPILWVGEEYAVCALPHQKKLLEWVANNNKRKKKLQDEVKNMKMELKIAGCPFEEADTLKVFMHSLDMQSALMTARQNIKSYLKYKDLDESYENHLEELFEILYVEGIDN